MLALVTCAWAGPVPSQGSLPPIGTAVPPLTDDVVVLAFDPVHGRVAFRRYVSLDSREEGDLVSCGYAGMEDRPTGGVQLGVYDLSEVRTTETWWIYEPVSDKAKCTPRATSEANLAAAKQRFRVLELDLSTPPALDDLAAVGLRAGPPSKPLPVPTDPDERLDGDLSQMSLYRGSEEIWHRAIRVSHLVGGAVEIAFPHAWKVEDGVLVLECEKSSGMRWQRRSCTFLQL